MKTRRFMAGAAVTAAAALVLAACNGGGTGDDPDTEPADGEGEGTGTADTSLTIGWNQSFYEYNNNSRTGNATANTIILHLMNDGFRYYDQDLNLVHNDDFGTFGITEEDEDGITVEFVVNEGKYWYGGEEPVPVDAADLMLYWAAHSGHVNTLDSDEAVMEQVEEELIGDYAEEGEDGEWEFPDDETEAEFEAEVQEVAAERLAEDNQVFFNGVLPTSIGLIEETPEIIEDGRGVSLRYSVPYVDWEYSFGVGVPAHVVGMRALDIDDPMEAKERVITAIQDNVVADLADIAAFWNTGFQFGDTLPEDELVYLSSGAYLMTDFQRDQYVTLTANPDYDGAFPAAIDEITVTISGDPMTHIQALQNQEVHLVQPQATPDTLAALEGLGDLVGIYSGDGPTYEHVDLVFNNGGPFDPETYGGDEDTARDVRHAFLNLIPRQEIVETQVQPLNPEAEVRHSFTQVPDAPDYQQMVETNLMDQVWPVETDLDAAVELIENAGVETPIQVRFMYDPTNSRRSNQYELIRDSVEREGLFELVDAGDVNWGSLLSDTTIYDASLFGWQSTSTAVGASGANYITDGLNNFGGFSNERVDELFDELNTETDAQAQADILAEVEQILVEEAFGTVIFQHELIAGYDSRLQGVEPIALSPTIFWNYYDWEFME